MKNMRQVLWGIVIALISVTFIVGGMLVSLAEGKVGAVPSTRTPTNPATDSSTSPVSDSSTVTSSPTPAPSASPTSTLFAGTPSPSPSAPPSASPSSTGCPPPSKWVPYTVQSGDTLAGLAKIYHTTADVLQKANCLPTDSLTPGRVLYVPPAPTLTPVPCGPPRGWVVYIVQKDDTLYHLSQLYGVTVAELQKANCLGQSTFLEVGNKLYVPHAATQTPIPSSTVMPTITDTPLPPLPTSLP